MHNIIQCIIKWQLNVCVCLIMSAWTPVGIRVSIHVQISTRLSMWQYVYSEFMSSLTGM